MDKDTLRKEIDYHINIKNNLWLAIVTTVGGTLALFLTMDNISKAIFVLIGFVSACFFINGYFAKDDEIEKLFKTLKKEDLKK